MGKGNSKCDLVKENVDKMTCNKACQSGHMGDQRLACLRAGVRGKKGRRRISGREPSEEGPERQGSPVW